MRMQYWKKTVVLFLLGSCLVEGIKAQGSYDDAALDKPTQKLIASFSKLVQDASAAENRSVFTRDLATSVISVLTNVPAAAISRRVERETGVAASNKLLPNPDQEACLMNYMQMCPDGWTDLGDGRRCKAPDTYTGDCDSEEDFSEFSALEKQQYSMKCSVAWPCKDKCFRNYKSACPEGWDNVKGLCYAPKSYNGPCVGEKNFTEYDSYSKGLWAKECGVKWPCKGMDMDFETQLCPVHWIDQDDGVTCKAPASYVGPCDPVQKIGTMSNKEKRSLALTCSIRWPLDGSLLYDFKYACPLGWTQLNKRYHDCHAPPEYPGPCQKLQSFESFTDEQKYDYSNRCNVVWPMRDVVARNFDSACPMNWILEKDSLCAAPATYAGPCTPRFNFKNYTADMKRAWADRCKAPFPITALEAAKKLKSALSGQIKGKAGVAGPFGSLGTKFEGSVMKADGTVYMPSRKFMGTRREAPVQADQTATAQIETQEHIANLEKMKSETKDPILKSTIQDAIDEMEAQGGSAQIVFK